MLGADLEQTDEQLCEVTELTPSLASFQRIRVEPERPSRDFLPHPGSVVYNLLRGRGPGR